MRHASLLLAAALAAAGLHAPAADTPAPAAEATATKTVTLKVDGMTCGNCSGAVNKKLKATKGVVSGQADHTQGTAVITYQPDVVKEADLVAAIQKLGFKAEVKP